MFSRLILSQGKIKDIFSVNEGIMQSSYWMAEGFFLLWGGRGHSFRGIGEDISFSKTLHLSAVCWQGGLVLTIKRHHHLINLQKPILHTLDMYAWFTCLCFLYLLKIVLNLRCYMMSCLLFISVCFCSWYMSIKKYSGVLQHLASSLGWHSVTSLVPRPTNDFVSDW